MRALDVGFTQILLCQVDLIISSTNLSGLKSVPSRD